MRYLIFRKLPLVAAIIIGAIGAISAGASGALG
jgi:hypothetical protein